jgi:hypothetical protein
MHHGIPGPGHAHCLEDPAASDALDLAFLKDINVTAAVSIEKSRNLRVGSLEVRGPFN